MHEKIYRAGLICYKIDSTDGQVYMNFMKPSDPTFGGSSYQIPKGRIEPGETAHFAAVREAKEEIGLLESSIVGEVIELGVFLGRTTFFICKVDENAIFGMPGFETEDTKWMTFDHFMEAGRDLHRTVVVSAYRKILSLEQIDN